MRKYKEYIETPTGSLIITENNTYDVLDKASVTVNVQIAPAELEITPKTTLQQFDVTNYTKVKVNKLYLDTTSADLMDSYKIEANLGKMYKYTGVDTPNYKNGRLYLVVQEV